MSKQLLFYESVVPVSSGRHGDVSVRPMADYAFCGDVNAVPLMAVEFPRAAAEYAIVFTRAGEDVLPAVVLGVKGNQNLYLASDGRWQAKYIPAFVRRYPFVFSSSDDGKTLTLCIDEAHPGVNRSGQGERLFEANGKPTPYVERVLAFLREYQAHFERTRALGRRIQELGVLQPMQAQVTTPKGQKLSLNGFLGVDRTKLRGLDGAALAELARSEALEALYLHLQSMRNFEGVKDRLIGSLQEDVPPAVAPAPETVQ